MKVLSLFDWMGCWMIALESAWIKVDKYYASEIDKYTIQVSKYNYPDIIQLWDIENWKEWELWDIDLIMWWSPCQWFSFAWKQLAFDDPRSGLFFTMVDIIKHYKPKFFLLENVKMKKEFQKIITKYMWVEPIEINSALVSAQNRKRLYRVWELQKDWIYKKVEIEQPKDKSILLKDILEDEVDNKYNISEKQWEKLRNYKSNSRLSNKEWKSYCLNTMQWWHRQPKIIQKIWDIDKNNYWIKNDKSYCLPANQMSDRWMIVMNPKITYAPWSREFKAQWWKEKKSPTPLSRDYKDPKIIETQLWQSKNFWNAWWSNKWYTLKTNTWHWVLDLENYKIRKLTPLECERLQTVPNNYTALWVDNIWKEVKISNTQRYKMLWNWWTVDVIAHILESIK